MDWTDNRKVKDLKFGAEWKPTIGDVIGPHGLNPGDDVPSGEVMATWRQAHEGELARMRQILDDCGCETVTDIEDLGCTGAIGRGIPLETIQFLRLGLAGSGVGLPCYVPPDRFCLVHGVTGGLQEGQEQRWPQFVEGISRALTPEESAKAQLIQEARGVEGTRKASDILSGRKLPKQWVPGDRPGWDGLMPSALIPPGADPPPLPLLAWKCLEHRDVDWNCRYCVAQLVVEGELEPAFTFEEIDAKGMSAEEISDRIRTLDMDGSPGLRVYVQAATFRRKLTLCR